MGDLIKSLFPEDKSKGGIKVNGKQRKYILSLLVVAVLGIAAMSVGNWIGNDAPAPAALGSGEKQAEIKGDEVSNNLAQLEKQMESSIADILAQIAGVGQVAVNLTLESSSQYEFAVNRVTDKTVITERAQDGSTRSTDETREDAQIVMKNMNQGKNEPVVVKEIRPQVVGVMVVAQGANDLVIRERISEAVQTLLNIPAHRVTVLPKESR
ncbi:MAG: hypothetical protein ACOYVD_04730 [Bacillota bacterium]